MSGQNRKQNNSSSSAILSTIAAVGIGAIAAAGAFFVGKTLGEEEAEAKLNARNHFRNLQQARQAPPPPPVDTSDEETDDVKEGSPEDRVEQECIICMCNFEDLKRRNVEIHTTPCGHIFCARCITRSLQRKHECPICKQPTQPGQTLRIFL